MFSPSAQHWFVSLWFSKPPMVSMFGTSHFSGLLLGFSSTGDRWCGLSSFGDWFGISRFGDRWLGVSQFGY